MPIDAEVRTDSSLDGQQLLAAETYVWGLQGLCQLHRIPFAPNLVLQQFPPPYDLLSFQRAATALGLKCGLREVSVVELSKLAFPFVAVLRSPASPNAFPGGIGASAPDTFPPCGLAIVIKCRDGQITYFAPERQHPLTVTLSEFGAQFTGKVMLCVPSAPDLKQDDTPSENPERFGFRWFVPELLRHRAI